MKFINNLCRTDKIDKQTTQISTPTYSVISNTVEFQAILIMVRDRLPELLASQNNSTTFGRGFLQDVHIQMSQNKKLKDLLDEAEEVRALIQLIAENISIVKELHSNVLTHTSKDIQKELETRTYTISQTSFRVQRKLRDMGKDVATIDNLTITSARDGPAYKRIKVLQYTTMMQLFSEMMADYSTSTMRYYEKCLLLLQQQTLLTRKEITNDELEVMLDSHENSLFVDNILEDSKIARLQLSDIQSRHNEVLKIEKSLTEVRDIFVELGFLIEKQGEQLSNVEFFAGTTADNVDSGRSDLKRAEKRSHRHRKRKIKIGIIFSIIVIVILLILLLS